MSAVRTSKTDIDSQMRPLRWLWIALLVSSVFCECIIELAVCPDANEWGLWNWVVTALAVYSALGPFLLSRRLLQIYEKRITAGSDPAVAIRTWKAAQMTRMSGAGAVSCYGLIQRAILGAELWQSSLFYAMSLILLLLWKPESPRQSSGTTVAPSLRS